MNIDYVEWHVLQDNLRDAFINYQWRLDNPMLTVGETEQKRITEYMCNSTFHAKVDSLTARTLYIVQLWLKEQNDL